MTNNATAVMMQAPRHWLGHGGWWMRAAPAQWHKYRACERQETQPVLRDADPTGEARRHHPPPHRAQECCAEQCPQSDLQRTLDPSAPEKHRSGSRNAAPTNRASRRWLHSHQYMVLNSCKLMAASSWRYCGFPGTSRIRPASGDNGGTTPITGFHSTIESPDSVSRVAPPTTSVSTIKAATTMSQARSHGPATETGIGACMLLAGGFSQHIVQPALLQSTVMLSVPRQYDHSHPQKTSMFLLFALVIVWSLLAGDCTGASKTPGLRRSTTSSPASAGCCWRRRCGGCRKVRYADVDWTKPFEMAVGAPEMSASR